MKYFFLSFAFVFLTANLTFAEAYSQNGLQPRYGSFAGFYTFQEVLAQLDSMRTLYPHIISKRDSIFYSRPIPTKNNPKKGIWMVRITQNPDLLQNKPAVLMTSLIHGNEPMGMMQMIYFMWYILENYQTDSRIRFLLATRELHFIPVFNPDGYVYNELTSPNGGGTWRMNRQRQRGETWESGGLDINRNFSYAYIGENNINPSLSDYFQGTRMFSAYETWGFHRFMQKPNQYILNVNFHTAAKGRRDGFILYPWNHSLEAVNPDSNLHKSMAKYLRSNLRYQYGKAIQYEFETFNTPTGTLEDYLYGEHGIHSLSVVIRKGFWPTPEQHVPIIENVLPITYRAAWLGGINPVIEQAEFYGNDGTQGINPGESGNLKVIIANQGILSTRTPMVINLTSTDTNVVITHGSIQLDTLPPFTKKNNHQLPFLLSVAQGSRRGDIIDLELHMTVDGGSMINDIRLIVGKPLTLLADTGGSMNQWIIEGTWGLTTDSYSGRFSITDSPDGVYWNNMTYKLINRQAFSFNNMLEPWLEYVTKWNIEPFYDFATVSLSTNGGHNWFNLKGSFGFYGSGEPPVQTDMDIHGYDDEQEDWIKERISLKAFEDADSVLIRFQLQTDGWIVGDGWYLDDLRVAGYPVENTAGFEKTQAFHLRNNYPNPFNPTTEIRFIINQSTSVSLAIYNVLGQKVAQLLTNKHYEPGHYRVIWNGRNSRSQAVSSGVYFYRLEANGKSETKKMMLIR